MTKTLVARIRCVVEAERRRFGVPGCSVVVVRDGTVLLAEGFGARDVDARLPVTAETLFPIGSATKTFTAAVLASLVDEGRLDFDRPVRDHLPGFRLSDPIATQLLSVRDCLSHRSGLPRHDALWKAGEGVLSRDEVIAALAHLPLSKPFRQTFQYNNLLFLLAGVLAGKLVGGSYEDAVRERVIEPLGMARTNFDVATTQADADFATPYVLPLVGLAPVQVPYASLTLAGPAGNINSCAQDLASWLFALLGHGVGGRTQLLTDAVLAELRTPAMAVPADSGAAIGRAVGYGLGLRLEDYRGHRLAYHGGNIDGFSSMVLTVVDEGIGIAVLTNLGGTDLRNAVPYRILDLLCGSEPTPHGDRLLARSAALREGRRQAQVSRKSNGKAQAAVRPLGDYVGEYFHPAYGTLTVGNGPDGLMGSLLGLPAARLEGRHLEVFDLVLEVGGDERRLPVQFTHDLDGDVDSARVLLEVAVAPLRFERQPETGHLTAELLASLMGTYNLGSLSIRVTLRGASELLASVDGAAPCALRPVRGQRFSLDGAGLEFLDDGRLVTTLGDFVRQDAGR